MSNNISLFGLATVLPSSAQSRNVGQSHQGWLRELEHAQAQMLNRDSQDNGHAAGSPDEQVSSEPRQMAAGAGTTGFESFSSQQRVSKNMFNAYTEKGASTFDTSSSTSESGIAAPIAADGTSASAKISDEPVFAT
ncbi:MAG TPA: hypothetical protein VFW00_13300, partial [Rhodocyclaceae bacterium]|nr:hypothetical protein [Rhodocyclaceae bacterium]